MARAKRNEAVAEEVRRILGSNAPEAVAFLVEIMRDEAPKPELGMKAAESILDRALGKTAAFTPDTGEGSGVIRFEGELEKWSR